MNHEDRKYLTSLITGVREEIKALRKGLAKVESVQQANYRLRKRNSELVAILEKHGLSADKKPKRGRPREHVSSWMHLSA